jgi:hypothetical protein
MSTYNINISQQSNKILVPTDDGKKNIGEITDRVFTKFNYHSKRHFCKKHQGIGLDQGAFTYYVLPHADTIDCQDKDSGNVYTISVDKFKRHLVEDNLGWGEQCFVSIKYWQVTEPDGNAPHQLSLWSDRR